MSNLKAIKRESTSSGSNNKLRSEGLIPAILYGGKDANLNISIQKKEIKSLINADTFWSKVLELEINGNTVRRSYSICSSPNSGLLQVGIKEVPNGIFSTYVNRKIKKGDEIKAGKPEGRFTFNSKNSGILLP